jgi:ABC-type sulfate transport system permease subunit
LKAGKALVDPRRIYKTRGLRFAAEHFLNDVACSYQSFIHIPCLRVFIKNFHKGWKQVIKLEKHKIQASIRSPPVISELDVLEQLAVHYGVPIDMFYDFESKFPNHVFTFFSHPLYYYMALRDYNT